MKKNIHSIFKNLPLLLIFIAIFFLQCQNQNSGEYKGLIGAWYYGGDLTRIGTSKQISYLDQKWGVNKGHGNDWSAQWEGFVEAPADGEVTFYAESNQDQEFIIEVADEKLLHIKGDETTSHGSIDMIKGHNYPIRVKYLQHSGGESYFTTYWSWADKEKEVIDLNALSFNEQQAEYWHYTEKPDPEDFDFSTLKTIPVENHIAFYESGRYAGWPANNGAWNWGDEILVGFSLSYFDPNSSGGHETRGSERNVVARSLDGGKTWKKEVPENYTGGKMENPENYKTSPGVNFTHPDFAMRIEERRYFVSYDRGKNWEGPYHIKVEAEGVEIDDLTSRTDYVVLGPDECIVFMSAETGLVETDYQDRSFAVRTTDGGKTFEFLGWMTHDTDVRSVMSTTEYIGDDHLVSVVRRKHNEKFGEGRPHIVKNWIEAQESKDNGKTWTALGKVAYTDDGDRNGNPPAMVKLPDGRLIVAYGYRAYLYGIRMKISSDKGKTWSDEIVLRSDGATWDIGYPRMVLRPDGRVVVMYYYTTDDNREQHIGVTIFDPDNVKTVLNK